MSWYTHSDRDSSSSLAERALLLYEGKRGRKLRVVLKIATVCWRTEELIVILALILITWVRTLFQKARLGWKTSGGKNTLKLSLNGGCAGQRGMSFNLTKAAFPGENPLNANPFYHFAMAYDIRKELASSCATPACLPYLELQLPLHYVVQSHVCSMLCCWL